MQLRRIMAGLAAAGMIAGGVSLAAAPAASAVGDQIWYQAVGRASADATCDIPPVAGDAAGWSGWAPSWAQWPNDGRGGWTCERSILWAKGSPPPEAAGSTGPGCLRIAGNFYVQFGTSNFVPAPTERWATTDCTGPSVPIPFAWAFAPDLQAANAICHNNGFDLAIAGGGDARVWRCYTIP